MAIAVRTNIRGLYAAEDLRRLNVQLGAVMRRLQTGFKINSAADDPSGLVIANIMSRNIRTLAVAQEHITKAMAMFDTLEDALAQISEKLALMKTQAERVVTAQASAERSVLSQSTGDAGQNAADELYQDIRRIARETQFADTFLLRGGIGNVVVFASTTSDQILGSLTAADIDVTGINLQGYATLAQSNQPLGNLVTVGQYLPTFFASLTGRADAATSFIQLNFDNGVASAVLWINGINAFTEAVAFATGFNAIATGPQVLDFSNLGLRVNLRQVYWGAGVSGLMTIGIDRNEAKFLAGTSAQAFGDYFKFELPNLEPENLLGTGPDGAIFTVDLRNAAQTAVNYIESAARYIDSIRARVGALRLGLETQKLKVEDLVIGHSAYRSILRDAELDKDAVELTALQVVQQSAVAMIAQARLQPQLVLQLFT